MRSLRRSFLLPLLWLPFSAFAAGGQWFDIPAQSLSEALKLFASQAKMQLLYEPDAISSALSNQLLGEYDEHAALESLLKGTGFEVVFTKANGATIRPVLNGVRASTSSLDSSGASSLRLAQTQEANEQSQTGSSVSAGTDKSDSKLEEVVVTATKRAEPLQDIPLSVSVLDEQTLIKAGDTNLIDYAKRIPNLSFGAGGDRVSNLYGLNIRGVGTGFYIDDVPASSGMNPRVMDISRIEVLRGPQGTLYGAGSMGGTVRLITKRADPTATEFKTHASLASVAEGDQDYAVDTAVNVPITSNLAFRSNLYYQHETGVHDIVVDNKTVAGDEVTHKNADEGEYWGLQALATWKPTEHLTVEPRFMYQNAHLDWIPHSDHRPGNFTAERVIDRADPNDDEWSISSLTVSWDTDWGHFTSATAFLNRESDSREEFSEFMNFAADAFFGIPNYYPPGGTLIAVNDRTKTITEEARFTSDFDGRLQLTTGVFYSKMKLDSHAPCSVAVGITDCVYSHEVGGETEEAAVFGELEYAISDDLFLTLGGRYFDNTNTNSILQSGLFGDGIQKNGKHSENGFNPKIVLKRDVTSDWTLYSSAAKGYRIGGANLSAVPPTCAADLAALGLSAAPDGFDSDSLWSYEMGSKSAHANGRFSLNAAAFFVDWSDLIQGVRLPSCGSSFTTNTGKAEVKGAEVEITGQAVDNLHYALGIGYTDAEITDPENAAGIVKGDPMQQVPEWTFNGNVDYRFNLGAAREGYFFLSYSWVDSSISLNNAGRANPRVRDAYDVLDARLGTTFGKWDISLFGKNLTNQHANLSDNLSLAVETPGRPRYVTNRPRTIGIDVRWAF